jgi:hypothetical protein
MATTTSRPELRDGQKVTRGRWRASGRVRVFAAGIANVEAFGSSMVWASGDAHVVLHDRARGVIHDGGVLVGRDDARAVSLGHSHLILWNRARARAYNRPGPNKDRSAETFGHSRIEAHGTAYVEISEQASGLAMDRSTVAFAPFYLRTTAIAVDQAVVVALG